MRYEYAIVTTGPGTADDHRAAVAAATRAKADTITPDWESGDARGWLAKLRNPEITRALRAGIDYETTIGGIKLEAIAEAR